MLKYRFHGPEGSAFIPPQHGRPLDLHLDVAAFFSNPGLWIGLAVAAVFLAAAIQLRHYRNPI